MNETVSVGGLPAQTGAQSAIGVKCLSCKQPVVDVTHDTGKDHDHLLLTHTLPVREHSPPHQRHEPHTPYFNANTTAVGEDQQKLLQAMMDSAAAESSKSSAQHPPKFSKLVRLLAVTNEQVDSQAAVGKTVVPAPSPGAVTVASQMTDDDVQHGQHLTVMEDGQYRSPLDASYSNLIATPNHGKIPVLSQIHSTHKQKDFVSWKAAMADNSNGKKTIDKVLHPGSNKTHIVKTLSESQFSDVNRSVRGPGVASGATVSGQVGAVSSGGSHSNGVIHQAPSGALNSTSSSRANRPTSAPSTRRNA